MLNFYDTYFFSRKQRSDTKSGVPNAAFTSEENDTSSKAIWFSQPRRYFLATNVYIILKVLSFIDSFLAILFTEKLIFSQAVL